MSTEDKAELQESETDVKHGLTDLGEQVSPDVSNKSSGSSWSTPASGTKSLSSPSSVSWDTPKSFQSLGERPEVVRGSDDDNHSLLPSPVISTIMIPDDDPPPYEVSPPRDEKEGLWSPLKYITDPFRDVSPYSSNRSRESASLIANPFPPVSTPPVSTNTSPTSHHSYARKSLSRISFRSYQEEYSASVKEEDTFARKYGTICIVAIFIVFLMILSLVAKFLINSTYSH